jgi:hypothetical protein
MKYLRQLQGLIQFVSYLPSQEVVVGKFIILMSSLLS